MMDFTVAIFFAVVATVIASVIFGKEDKEEGNKMKDRHFICIDSFESEGRYAWLAKYTPHIRSMAVINWCLRMEK